MKQIFVDQMILNFFKEDGIDHNFIYLTSLPEKIVTCELKIKSNLLLSGLPIFFRVFELLLPDSKKFSELFQQITQAWEGKKVECGMIISFELPFSVAITGERLALNLLQKMSSISTTTHYFSEITRPFGIKIIDTRKTTPGLKILEKYAVVMGGGSNHRMHQSDVFMIKDNHKTFFGGLKEAYDFFLKTQSVYTPLIAEIHHFDEIEIARSLKIKHLLLDHFSQEAIKEVVKSKQDSETIEISGGINQDTVKDFLIEGVDFMSVGQLTYGAKIVDVSMKVKRR